MTLGGLALSLVPLMTAARLGSFRTAPSGLPLSGGPSPDGADARSLVDAAGSAWVAPAWLDEIHRATDAHLTRHFEQRRALTRTLLETGDSELLPAIEALTMRGGKRLRPAMLIASFRALSPDAPWARAVPACAALELLQSYLLIHDDWMDGDDQRRGGPSVHAFFRERTGKRELGDALAILAGDFASAMAWELFVEGALACPGGTDAIGIFGRIHHEVVLGQEMDLSGARDVTRMQRLKTGSYTVTGPLEIGAILAGGQGEVLAALRAFGEPLGEAFQVKDDLLGVFGEEKRTGKPIGSDLRAGRRNALLRECERLLSAADRAALEGVLGRATATDEEIRAVTALFERTGIRARVEERLDGLLTRALAALDAGPFSEPGKSMLRDLARWMVQRDR